MAQALERRLGLAQATALNMIDMVGIGPFVTMSMVVAAMHGPQSIVAWLAGMLLAFTDAFVWSELGAAMPQAGGTYVFLRETYGPGKLGRLMSFLFIWQTMIQAPLVVASGAIGFSDYFGYLWLRLGGDTLTFAEQHAIAGALVLILLAVLYRGIATLGRISVILGIGVIGTIAWIIVSGLTHFDASLAFTYTADAWDLSGSFLAGLGAGCLKTVYSYLGYYNVCHLGGEVREPERLIPRSMFISIAGIAVLYVAMNISVLGVLPWKVLAFGGGPAVSHAVIEKMPPLALAALGREPDKYPVSTFMEHIYGTEAATAVTVLILVVAFSSLFAVVLGYSRIPYAAALDGNFFRVFARTHPRKHFPHVSLVVLCAIAFVFSLRSKLADVITAILAMRIVIQFIGQAVGVIVMRRTRPEVRLPFRMWLFPLPAIVAIAAWGALFGSTGTFMYYGLAAILSGLTVYLVRARFRDEWPFEKPPLDEAGIEAGADA